MENPPFLHRDVEAGASWAGEGCGTLPDPPKSLLPQVIGRRVPWLETPSTEKG
jgi:hypothetical protein